MNNTEIYTYTRKEIQDNLIIESRYEKNNIVYITEKSIVDIYLPNSQIKFGKISFINNLTILNDINNELLNNDLLNNDLSNNTLSNNTLSNNTSIVTLITKEGSLVFNLNYLTIYGDSKPNAQISLITKPTFTSGKYLNYNNIKITINILGLFGERIVIIEYMQ